MSKYIAKGFEDGLRDAHVGMLVRHHPNITYLSPGKVMVVARVTQSDPTEYPSLVTNYLDGSRADQARYVWAFVAARTEWDERAIELSLLARRPAYALLRCRSTKRPFRSRTIFCITLSIMATSLMMGTAIKVAVLYAFMSQTRKIEFVGRSSGCAFGCASKSGTKTSKGLYK